MEKTNVLPNAPSRYVDAHLEVDFARRFAVLDSRPLALRRKEYELLSLLVDKAGEVVPRKVLLTRVWGYGKEAPNRTLDVHVRRLRQKLGPRGKQYVETIFGIGYRFQPFRTNHRL